MCAGVRTRHARVRALRLPLRFYKVEAAFSKLSGLGRCAQECAHGTQECVRYGPPLRFYKVEAAFLKLSGLGP